MRRTEVDTWFVLWAALVLLVCLVLVGSAGGPPLAGDGGGRGQPRDVPMDRLLQRIEAGRLSRHPALHTKPMGEQGADRRPSRPRLRPGPTSRPRR
jgi:hypothetical protein